MEPTPGSSHQDPLSSVGADPGHMELRCRGWGYSTGKPKREPLPRPQAQGTGDELDSWPL